MSSSVIRTVENSSLYYGNNVLVREIPAKKLEKVCRIIHNENKWRELGRHMGYSDEILEQIKNRAKNGEFLPTKEIISMWAEHDHTVTELFMILFRLKLFMAMSVLQDLVDARYHRYILDGNSSVSPTSRPSGIPMGKAAEASTTQASLKVADVASVVPALVQSPLQPASKGVDELISSLPHIDFNELAQATENWKVDNILGEGAFGVVYKGIWKYTPVAIKRLKCSSNADKTGEKLCIEINQLRNELQLLNRYRHPNILPLYAFGMNDKVPCLVYEFVNGGSLQSRLSGRYNGRPLSLSERFYIAKGAARGLQFLHTVDPAKPLIHADIKPANILLDASNVPKIGDFGLSREGLAGEPIEISRAFGTRPYIPYEFLALRLLSTKVDIFSFGVVLFELITGLPAYDPRRDKRTTFLYDYVKSCSDEVHRDRTQFAGPIDQTFLRDDESFKLFKYLYKLGLECLASDANKRPEMAEVFKYFKKLDGNKD